MKENISSGLKSAVDKDSEILKSLATKAGEVMSATAEKIKADFLPYLRKVHIFKFHSLPLNTSNHETVFLGDNFDPLTAVQNAFNNFNRTPVKNDFTLVHSLALQFSCPQVSVQGYKLYAHPMFLSK